MTPIFLIYTASPNPTETHNLFNYTIAYVNFGIKAEALIVQIYTIIIHSMKYLLNNCWQ